MVQKMLKALASYKVMVEEVQDAAATLGNKLPSDLDSQLKTIYAESVTQHVKGEDSSEVASIVTKLNNVIDTYIGEQYESKQADLRIVLAPVTAVLEKYAVGLREHALSVVCALFSRFMAVESSFIDIPSNDQAMAALVKANVNSLDAVYKV